MQKEDQKMPHGAINTTIREHEGKKYLRRLTPTAVEHYGDAAKDIPGLVLVDVYSVLEAYHVTCPARAQAVKKLLMAGERGKGSILEDLIGAKAAVERAIELQHQREKSCPTESVK